MSKGLSYYIWIMKIGPLAELRAGQDFGFLSLFGLLLWPDGLNDYTSTHL